MLETREAERSIADAAMRADMVLRSQSWAATEHALFSKARGGGTAVQHQGAVLKRYQQGLAACLC